MADLKSTLDRNARRFRPNEDGFERLLERADRRHRSRRFTSAAVALVVAVAGSLGAYSMLTRGTTSADSGAWRGLWPQQSVEDARIAQARANAGDHRLTWQADAREFLYRFGDDALGWVNLAISELSVDQASGNGPLVAQLRGCPIAEADDSTDVIFCQPATLRTAEVTFERLLQPDEKGLWFVTAATVDGQAITPSNSPPAEEPDPAEEQVPAGVTAFVEEFMESRVAGTDYARDRLTDEGADQFHTGEGGLELYGYTREPAATWEIATAGPGPDELFTVVVRIEGSGGSFPESGVIVETLTIGRVDDHGWFVMSAERND